MGFGEIYLTITSTTPPFLCFQAVLHDHDRSRITSLKKDDSDPRALAYVYQHQDSYSLFYIKMANLVTHSLHRNNRPCHSSILVMITFWFEIPEKCFANNVHCVKSVALKMINWKKISSSLLLLLHKHPDNLLITLVHCVYSSCLPAVNVFGVCLVRQIPFSLTSRRYVRRRNRRHRRNLQRHRHKSEKIFFFFLLFIGGVCPTLISVLHFVHIKTLFILFPEQFLTAADWLSSPYSWGRWK